MDFKVIFGILATIVAIIAFIPYFRDILRGKTQPHVYSWLVWCIIQSVGVMAMFKGGAGWGALGLGGWYFTLSDYAFIFFKIWY